MSGPKVVRIVTREEIITICQGQLARVDSALAEWIRIGHRNDCISDADVAAAQARRDALGKLFAASSFNDLQKAAPQEVAYLRYDQQDRLTKLAAEAANARAAERRYCEAARALLAALKRTGNPLEPALELALQGVASGQQDSSAMTQGFALLTAEPEANAESRRTLARRLKDGDDRMTLADWLSTQPAQPVDLAVQRLEGRLTELMVIAGPEVSVSLEARLRKALGEPAHERRGLLLDSLEMDLGRTLAEAKKRAGLVDEVRLLLAELEQCGSPVLDSLMAKCESATSMAALTALLGEAQLTLAQEREKLGAHARRTAVLKSLAGLGYEVTEGLSTAWVEQGRVVLRKAAQPSYGVEISGDLETSRVQMRAVAFTGGAASPDPVRDRDAETLWCGDVSALQAQLAAVGGGLEIERALAIGATPLKRLLEPTSDDRYEAREGPTQRTRTLR
jgi:hypothetical protein